MYSYIWQPVKCITCQKIVYKKAFHLYINRVFLGYCCEKCWQKERESLWESYVNVIGDALSIVYERFGEYDTWFEYIYNYQYNDIINSSYYKQAEKG